LDETRDGLTPDYESGFVRSLLENAGAKSRSEMLEIAFIYGDISHHQKSGGGAGIRTPETLSGLTVFKAGGCALARW
jgi:hypothetical protein